MATDHTTDALAFDHTRAVYAMQELIAAFGVPLDEHTANTPNRVAKAWATMVGGYGTDPRQHLAVTFPVEGDPGLVMVSGIHVQSTCAHHLLPITGTATVAYRPDPEAGRVVGLSKLSRLVEGYARRLQVQERLGAQVAAALDEVLHPIGAAVVITAEHGCMTIRGVEQRGTTTTTLATTGQYRDTLHADLALIRAEHARLVP